MQLQLDVEDYEANTLHELTGDCDKLISSYADGLDSLEFQLRNVKQQHQFFLQSLAELKDAVKSDSILERKDTPNISIVDPTSANTEIRNAPDLHTRLLTPRQLGE